MVTQHQNGLVRVTVTLEAEDVRLLDAVARLDGQNRSAELRGLLAQVRPVLVQLVSTFEQVEAQRASLDTALVDASVSELEAIRPEMDQISRRFLGAMAKLEGHATAAGEAPASNTGATD